MSQISALFKLVSFFWSHADQVVALLQALTSKLPVVGQAMVSAGNFVVATADTLHGGGPTPLNASKAVTDAASALETGRQRIVDIESNIQTVKDQINGIHVPTIQSETKKFPVFGYISFLETDNITHIKQLNDNSPFTSAADALGTVKNMLISLDIQLTGVKNNLVGLSSALDQMGSDMKESGNALITVGQIFQELG